MKDNELDLLLSETLTAEIEKPNYMDTRLRGELAVARKAGRGLSLWWLPLALTLGLGAPTFLLGVLMPWPVSVVLQVSAVLAAVTAAVFTAVGLACFDLREKGRVVL